MLNMFVCLGEQKFKHPSISVNKCTNHTLGVGADNTRCTLLIGINVDILSFLSVFKASH